MLNYFLRNFFYLQNALPSFITNTMFTGTLSLSSGQALRSGTHPFKIFNKK